jgi:hypothetical protein
MAMAVMIPRSIPTVKFGPSRSRANLENQECWHI